MAKDPVPKISSEDFGQLVDAWQAGFTRHTGTRYLLQPRDRQQLLGCFRKAPPADIIEAARKAWLVPNWFLDNGQLHPGTFAKHLHKFLALKVPPPKHESIRERRQREELERDAEVRELDKAAGWEPVGAPMNSGGAS